MCELCVAMREAHENGDSAEIDRTEIAWFKEKIGDSAGECRAIATQQWLDEHAESFPKEWDMMGRVSEEFIIAAIGVLKGFPKELAQFLILTDQDSMTAGGIMAKAFQMLFIYGIICGRRNELAMKVLTGEVYDDSER